MKYEKLISFGAFPLKENEMQKFIKTTFRRFLLNDTGHWISQRIDDDAYIDRVRNLLTRDYGLPSELQQQRLMIYCEYGDEQVSGS